MKKSYLYPKIIVAVLIIFSLSALHSDKIEKEPEYISIEKHIKDFNIKAEVISKGGHSKDCIDIHVQNLKKDTLNIIVEPGRRLVSKDSSIQDILIVKKRKIRLAPFAKFIIGGYGYCCQSSNGSPSQGKKFKIGFMAPKTWVKLAEFIDTLDFPSGAVQSAIWVMSNNHPISSIYDKDPEKVRLLREKVAELKKIELPWYSLTYEKDTAMLFTNKAEMLYGKINYKIKNNTVISVNVRNENGDKVKTLIDGVSKGPGKYFLDLKLSVKNWPKGKYQIFIIEDYANLNTKKSFKL